VFYKIYGYYNEVVYVQLIRSTTGRYVPGQQHGPTWKCIYRKNKPRNTLEITEIYRGEFLKYMKEL